MKIIDHNHHKYRQKQIWAGMNRYNGAYYYSREIVKYIIPNVITDRNWITINLEGVGASHSIVFIHNNLNPELYDHLGVYNDLILVCGVPETCEKVKHLGKTIYLPLSVKISDVERYMTEKTEDTAFAGRPCKKTENLPKTIDYLQNMPRNELLQEMAKYRNIYAIGRTAIEAKILGCNILPYDKRFPDADVWKVIDSLEAAKMLQEKLSELEGR